MAIRKNKKRIDPRYFLNETTHRDEIEEGFTTNMPDNVPTTAQVMGRDDAPTSTSSGARVPEKYQALADKLIQQGNDARKVEQTINACAEEALRGARGQFVKCMYRKDTSSIYAMQDLGMIPQQKGA